MKILWNKQFRREYLWEPNCGGQFIKQENHVAFIFKDDDSLLAFPEKDTLPRLLYTKTSNEILPLPIEWTVVETPDDIFLMVSEDQGLNLKNNIFFHDVPEHIRMEFKKHFRPLAYYVTDPQSLGEYTILHKDNWGYICMKEDEKLWEFNGRAYLYTDMMRWKDRLFFGTAGQGGYFYVLDLNTGVPLASIKTGGTRRIVQVDNLCYILRREKRTQLVCVDLSDGRIVSQCDLPGKSSVDSAIAMIDNRIHAITFNYSRSIPVGFIWSCIEI